MPAGLAGKRLGYQRERCARRGGRLGEYEWFTLVASLAQAWVEGNATEYGHFGSQNRAEALGNQVTATYPEQIERFAAVWAGERTHVLHYAEDFLMGLLSESSGAHRYVGRTELRSGDDDEFCMRQQLGGGDCDVSGAWWQVE